jgi:two-component system NarL family sensor kinase
MPKLLLFLLWISTSLAANAQVPTDKDSVLTMLATAKEDTNKVNLLLSAEKIYFAEDLDSALHYNKECEKLIAKISANSFQHRCYHEFVKIYHALGDYKNALSYCLKSMAVAKRNNDKFQEATSSRAIFNIYHNLQMNDSAVKYAVYSIKLTEEIKDTSNLATNLGNLSWLYMDLDQYDQAIDYGKKGIAAGEKYKDTLGMLVALNNTALCYHRMGKNEESIRLTNYQIEIAKKIKRRRSIERGLINLATAYYDLNDAAGLDRTAKQLNDHLALSKSVDPKIRIHQYTINAYNAMFKSQFNQAEDTLLEAMKMAREDSIIDVLFTVYSALSSVQSAKHNFSMAAFYDRKYDSLSDGIKKQELSEYALELEAKYETEKKDGQLKLQQVRIKQKDTINYLLIGGAAALLIISLLSYRNYRQKQYLQQQRISELETENKLTAAEAVLKGEEQERTRLAKDLHDGLGGMLSGIKYSLNAMRNNLVMTPDNVEAFERSIDMLDNSIHEMRRVAHNMMPEALVKFGLDVSLKDFCNDINKSGALKVQYQSIGMENATIGQTTSIAIYRIVQELINNVIKHAGANTAIVQVSKTNDDITVTVEDDGHGFDPAVLNNSGGIGWANIRSRVEYLNGRLDMQTAPGEPTSILIELKAQG